MGPLRMPWPGWLRPQRGSLKERVRQALAQARAGDPDGAFALIPGRYGEAFAELRALDEPADTGWLQLAARLRYRAGEMAEAARLAEQALAAQDTAGTWHLLGRIRVWLRQPEGDRAFARAEELDPEHFVRPYRVRRDRFARLADGALARIPSRFQDLLANTMIVVDDLPALDAVRQGEDPDLLGIYEGATVLEHGFPERIVLYQRNHENISADERELREQVEETMRHEIGHHFGMEEDELPY